MSFEIMLANSPAAQKAVTQQSQAKIKASGTESAFQALMSLALTALFGGGAGPQVVAENQTVPDPATGEKTGVDGAAQVTSTGAETLWTPKGETAGGTTVGQKFPVVGESRSGGEAKVAGLVETAAEAIETGGHTDPISLLMVPQQDAVASKNAGPDMAESFASPAAAPGLALEPAPEAVNTQAEKTVAFAVTGRETTDVAVAPDYRFQSYGGRDAVAASENPEVPYNPRQVEGEAPLAAGERSAAAVKTGGPAPEGKAPTQQPMVSIGKTGVTEPVRSEAREGELFAISDEADSDDAMSSREPVEGKAPAPDFTLVEAAVGPKTHSGREVMEQAAVMETAGENETHAARSLRDVRAISQTLLEESMKRLPRSVELTLDPPQMGSVTALLSQRGQDVTVKFVAHSNDAQRMLQAATDDLARSLGEKGLVLTGFSVDPGYRDDRGQERRENTGKSGASRYGRVSRLAAVTTGVQVKQVSGSFNWLA